LVDFTSKNYNPSALRIDCTGSTFAGADGAEEVPDLDVYPILGLFLSVAVGCCVANDLKQPENSKAQKQINTNRYFLFDMSKSPNKRFLQPDVYGKGNVMSIRNRPKLRRVGRLLPIPYFDACFLRQPLSL
jgi:hypothetical protein